MSDEYWGSKNHWLWITNNKQKLIGITIEELAKNNWKKHPKNSGNWIAEIQLVGFQPRISEISVGRLWLAITVLTSCYLNFLKPKEFWSYLKVLELHLSYRKKSYCDIIYPKSISATRGSHVSWSRPTLSWLSALKLRLKKLSKNNLEVIF